MPILDSCLVWFRRDLRSDDHAALSAALRDARRVWCVFIFDREILDPLLALSGGFDRRVEFIHASVIELDQALKARGGGLIVIHDFASAAIVELAAQLNVSRVYANRDYEPAAFKRDSKVATALLESGREFVTFKDQVIFETDEVVTGAGHFFSVFTPYKNAWLKRLRSADLDPHIVDVGESSLAPVPAALRRPIPTLPELGFAATGLAELGIVPGANAASVLFERFLERIEHYRAWRDYPAIRGASYLSVHLRFGTISIRTLARAAHLRSIAGRNEGAETWLSELIWREFYMQILFHRPDVVTRSFKPEYDRLAWIDGELGDARFATWCEGRTGYPLIDAAMEQLNRTGYMHNRLRMVSASFLVKDLGIDWRRGEAYFALKLNDFDLSANNGGWQWAASSGCDAQPYFRIFNPVLQSERFDPEGKFIKRYLPVLAALDGKQIHAPWQMSAAEASRTGVRVGLDYPLPIVEHGQARAETLERFGRAVNRLKR